APVSRDPRIVADDVVVEPREHPVLAVDGGAVELPTGAVALEPTCVVTRRIEPAPEREGEHPGPPALSAGAASARTPRQHPRERPSSHRPPAGRAREWCSWREYNAATVTRQTGGARMRARAVLPLALIAAVAALALAGVPAHGQAPKRGGILNAMLGEDPPG